MWSDAERLESLARNATWSAAILGLLAGLAAFVAVIAQNRADKLKAQAKHTPPRLVVTLAYGEDERLRVVIDSHSRVPFEFQWKIVTRNNLIISGIPLDWNRVYPKKSPHRFLQVAALQPERIVEGYVELRFQYRSIYAEEVGLPDLAGRIDRGFMLDPVARHIRPV